MPAYLLYLLAIAGGYVIGKKYLKKPMKKQEPAPKTDTLKASPATYDNWSINVCKDKCVSDGEVMSAFTAHKPIYVNVEIEGDYSLLGDHSSKKGHYKTIIKTLPIDLPEKDGKKYIRTLVYKTHPDGLGPKLREELIFSINQINSITPIVDKKEQEEAIDFLFKDLNIDSNAQFDLSPENAD